MYRLNTVTLINRVLRLILRHTNLYMGNIYISQKNPFFFQNLRNSWNPASVEGTRRILMAQVWNVPYTKLPVWIPWQTAHSWHKCPTFPQCSAHSQVRLGCLRKQLQI